MRRDHQVGKRLVVFQLLVVFWLNVLDQARLRQQRVDFAFAFHEIQVCNFAAPSPGCDIRQWPASESNCWRGHEGSWLYRCR